MTLNIGGPAPIAAASPTQAAQQEPSQAVVMARQAIAASESDNPSETLAAKEQTRPISYGVQAPVHTNKNRETHNQQRTEQRIEARRNDDARQERGSKVDIEA